MKIIFLDIDGVLNNQIFLENIENRKSLEQDYRWFDKRCVELLNDITNKTKAKIVVSSSWRKNRSVEQLKELFLKVGISGEVIDKTPCLYFSETNILKVATKEPIKYSYSVPRGCEIKAWIEINKDILGEKVSKLKYVILDDDSDMLYWQRENYFRIDAYCGLTPNLAYKITNFLSD